MAQGLRHLLRALVTASLLVALFASTSAPASAATDRAADQRSAQVAGSASRGAKPKKPKKTKKQIVQEIRELGDEPNVDPALVTIAAAVAEVSPDAELRVMLFGEFEADETTTVRRELVDGVASVSVAVDALVDLVAQPGVAYVAPDVPVRPLTNDDVAVVGGSFTLLNGASHAWDRGRTGRGVGVAIVDSGIGAPAAFGKRVVRAPLGGAEGDAHGHGTFVAGVLGARTSAYLGVAPDVTLYDVNVAQPDGVYTSDVIAGLRWVAANSRRLNIRVVNLSLAETIPSSYKTNLLDRAVEHLWRSGVVVVAAVGNGGPGAALYAPGNSPYAISVGAVDPGMTLGLFDDAPAAFSATGPTLDAVAKPDLLAPGRRIVSFLQEGSALAHAAPAENLLPGGLAFMSGTSFAAPQVAAAAAILLQAHPRWTPNQVKWALTRTSRPVARSGAGTLDLRAALRYAARPGNANSALPGATALPGFEAAAANAAVAGDTWSSNTWSSNTWSSNTWSSNTWSSNTWSSNTWSSTADAFTR